MREVKKNVIFNVNKLKEEIIINFKIHKYHS